MLLQVLSISEDIPQSVEDRGESRLMFCAWLSLVCNESSYLMSLKTMPVPGYLNVFSVTECNCRVPKQRQSLISSRKYCILSHKVTEHAFKLVLWLIYIYKLYVLRYIMCKYLSCLEWELLRMPY